MENEKIFSRGWKIFRNILFTFCLLNLGFAFIPDIGTFAIFSGGLAVILSGILLVKTIKTKAAKRIAIISLLLSVASVGGGYWTFTRIMFNFTIKPGWGGIYMPH
jgi:hypothetical protein